MERQLEGSQIHGFETLGALNVLQINEERWNRWLNVKEICAILYNYSIFKVQDVLLQQPTSGTLVLFDRTTHRKYKFDGHTHNYRKKKDGQNVNECHVKLKIGGVNRLNAYYARGDVNPNFYRRSYNLWDDNERGSIVLVHYRDTSLQELPPTSLSLELLEEEVINAQDQIRSLQDRVLADDDVPLMNNTYADQCVQRFFGGDENITKPQAETTQDNIDIGVHSQGVLEADENSTDPLTQAERTMSPTTSENSTKWEEFQTQLRIACLICAGNKSRWEELITEVTKTKISLEVAVSKCEQYLKQLISAAPMKDVGIASLTDKGGVGIIHLCSRLGYSWVGKIYKDSSLSLDTPDDIGWTALHFASFYEREEAVATLLFLGADPNVCTIQFDDPYPLTPSDMASKRGYIGLAAFIAEKALLVHSNTPLYGNSLDESSNLVTDARAAAGGAASRILHSLPDRPEYLSVRNRVQRLYGQVAALEGSNEALEQYKRLKMCYDELVRAG